MSNYVYLELMKYTDFTIGYNFGTTPKDITTRILDSILLSIGYNPNIINKYALTASQLKQSFNSQSVLPLTATIHVNITMYYTLLHNTSN